MDRDFKNFNIEKTYKVMREDFDEYYSCIPSHIQEVLVYEFTNQYIKYEYKDQRGRHVQLFNEDGEEEIYHIY